MIAAVYWRPLFRDPAINVWWGCEPLSDLGYADASGDIAWCGFAKSSVVLISLTAQWIKDAGHFQAPVWRRPHLWRQKRGTNTSLEVKDLRDPSESEKERRGMERVNIKDSTGNIKQDREKEKEWCWQQNGIEEAWHPSNKLWTFSTRGTWEDNHVFQHLSQKHFWVSKLSEIRANYYPQYLLYLPAKYGSMASSELA